MPMKAEGLPFDQTSQVRLEKCLISSYFDIKTI